MEFDTTLNATYRTELGKGPAKQLRREGLIPAVFYGTRKEATPLTVNAKELKNIAFGLDGGRSLFQLKIEKEGAVEEKLVMMKDYQIDPLKRVLTHADFYEVEVDRPLQLEVPLILTGKPNGVEKGGMLQQIRRELTISALPKDLPDQIVVDMTPFELGQSLHVADVNVAEGVEVVYDVNFTLATVIPPKGVKAGEEEGEEEGEGEAGAGE